MKSPIAVVQVAALVATACSLFAVGTASAAPSASPATGSAAAAADAYMARRTPSLRATAADAFTRGAVREGTNGLQYFPYSRKHAGLPVIGGDVVVATDAKHQVIDADVAQDSAITIATEASISAAAAKATARARVARVTSVSTPRLVITAVDGTHLAWETTVTGSHDNHPTRLHVFTDARSGKHIGAYDEVVRGTGDGHYSGSNTPLATTNSGNTFTMVDTQHPGVSCSDQSAKTLTGPDDLWGNGSGTDLETACVDVLHAADKQWQMLNSWLGRDGFDGKGRGFPMRVGLNDLNAYWNGTFADFGHSSDDARQLTSLDIVGHELGHAVFGNTGLFGSGSINEGTADIFGTLTEYFANEPNDVPDYLIGERADFYGTGAIRNFYNPSTMSGGINCWSATIEDQEVHAAAGVLDHWFYLLAEGSAPAGKPASPICAGGPSSIAGLGQLTAAKIFYNALQLKSYTWRYPEARIATLQAARNLYPNSCTEFTKVKNAWKAVGVAAQSGEPVCPSTGGTFGLAVSGPIPTIIAGKSSEFDVTTTLISGSAREVTLSASGLPSGATVEFRPTRLMAGTTAKALVSVPAETPGGTSGFTITGVSGTETHSIPADVTVQPWRSDDFTMSLSPTSATVPASGSRDFILDTQVTSGSPQDLVLRVDQAKLPGGVSVSYSHAGSVLQSGNNATVTLQTSANTPLGTYTMTVFGDGDYRAHNATLTYTVTAPNEFSFEPNPLTLSLQAGSSKDVVLTSTVVSGVAENIAWDAVPVTLPAGISATFSPANGPAGGTTTMTLTAAPTADTGSFIIALRGTAETSTQTRTLPLTVAAAPVGFCSGYANGLSGSLSAGTTSYRPSGGSFTAAPGAHKVCLDGPAGADFDLYLQKKSSTGTWSTVATAATSSADEKLTYTGAAGTYRYKIVSSAGSGSYQLAYTKP